MGNHTYGHRVLRACEELKKQLDAGREWPDAHSDVCVKHGVDGDDVAEQFDRNFAGK